MVLVLIKINFVGNMIQMVNVYNVHHNIIYQNWLKNVNHVSQVVFIIIMINVIIAINHFILMVYVVKYMDVWNYHLKDVKYVIILCKLLRIIYVILLIVIEWKDKNVWYVNQDIQLLMMDHVN